MRRHWPQATSTRRGTTPPACTLLASGWTAARSSPAPRSATVRPQPPMGGKTIGCSKTRGFKRVQFASYSLGCKLSLSHTVFPSASPRVAHLAPQPPQCLSTLQNARRRGPAPPPPRTVSLWASLRMPSGLSARLVVRRCRGRDAVGPRGDGARPHRLPGGARQVPGALRGPRPHRVPLPAAGRQHRGAPRAGAAAGRLGFRVLGFRAA